MRYNSTVLLAILLAATVLCAAPARKKKGTVRRSKGAAAAATAKKTPAPAARAVVRPAVATSSTRASMVPAAYHVRTTAPVRRTHVVTGGPWKSPTYADSTIQDNVDGEDLTIRRAAVEALGPFNGSVVVADPTNGRILTIVNQKLALQSGFQPCSTIKIVAALAAMSEGIMDPHTPIFLSRRYSLDLREALAHSNNPYFATLGNKLGYKRIVYYASLFGLGEKAGLDLDNERPGVLPPAPPADGVGMMTSFGEGISLTPLELAALLSSISNGGTLYYLQYPRTREEAEHLVPRVKRQLEFGPWLADLKTGMKAVTDYGTGRRAAYDPNEPIMGKTGTCTDYRQSSHMGWFGSFNETGQHKLVVVVMLTGGRSVSGPVAAGVAGGVYKALSHQNYFASTMEPGHKEPFPVMVSTPVCCATPPKTAAADDNR
jgi:penicillin-binding protein 2